MFAGHIGAGLAIARVEPRVNAGVFIIAALLLDFLLWLFVLLGWESLTIPANFVVTHQVTFEFPYSHGLATGMVWALLAGACALAWTGQPDIRRRTAALLALAVFSHWLLDALVHQPELPLFGAGSTKLGLGLWHNLPVALVVEAVITAAGLWLYLSAEVLTRAKALALAALTLLTLGFTVIGMTLAPAPPSPRAMAAASLITLMVVSGLACWLGRVPDLTLRQR